MNLLTTPVFRFSLGQKSSQNCDYDSDSDSVASEKQPIFLYLQDIHKELEEKISRFHEREDAILYACCFDANTGLFEALLSPDDAVLSDELNHASIIDGIRLCKAKKFRYKNKDMAGMILTNFVLA